MKLSQEAREYLNVLALFESEETWHPASYYMERYTENYHQQISLSRVQNILSILRAEGHVESKPTRKRNYVRNVYRKLVGHADKIKSSTDIES